MIHNIFWDIDETLLHSSMQQPFNKDHIETKLDDDEPVFTIFRPCAVSLIEFSRELVGRENVFILTTSVKDYANRMNEAGGFGFRPDQIFHRGTIRDHRIAGCYGAFYRMQPHTQANPNNVLIDNLPLRYNSEKANLIGIKSDRYFQIRDYHGVNFPNDPFESQCKEFLTTLHNE